MENEVKTQGGVGFVGLLTIALIVLKLCGVIAWPWWLVILGPFMCSLALALAIVGIVMGIAFVITEYRDFRDILEDKK